MKQPNRILIVEDKAADADLAKRTIQKVLKDCEFQVVGTRDDFLTALQIFQPEVILSDYSLPRFDGMKALRLALNHAPLTPLIIWTGSISEDVAVECMKAGANNYVLKENLKRLAPAVIHALEERQLLLERKQAEETIQNSEKRFRALIENGLDNISLLKADGSLIWESPSAIRLLDYAPDEYIGQSIFTLIHPDDLKLTQNLYAKLAQEPGSHSRGKFRLRHADGTWRWVEAIVTNMLREPSVNAIVVNYRDITERKQAEDARREEQNLLRTLIDNIPDRIYAMDRQGRKTLSNAADWKASGGKSMEDVIGKTDFDIYPRELAEPFWQIDQTVLDSGQPIINFEEPGLDFEGNLVSILTTKIPLRDEAGNVTGLVGVGRDITERKQAEENLRESENRYRLVTKATNDVIWEWNPQTHQLLWSENASHVFGYSPEEIGPEEKWWDDHIHPDDRERVITKLNALIAGHESIWMEEYRLLLHNGAYAYIGDRAYIERDEDGTPLRMIGAMSDITARKQADIELQQKNDDLGLLNAINEAVVRGQNLDSIIELLAKELQRIFSNQNSTIYSMMYMLSPDKQSLTMQQYSFGSEVELRIEKLIGFNIPRIELPIKEGGHFHKVLISGRSAIMSEAQEIQDWIAEFTETKFLPSLARVAVRKFVPQIYGFLNLKSIITVPLISQGEVIGFWDVSGSSVFTANDLKRIEKIGGQLTAVIQRQQANERIQRSEEFLQSIQNALSASLAILDETGTVVQVNSAWREFGEQNGLGHQTFCVGLNYLEICDSATGAYAEEAPIVAEAIRDVSAGYRNEALVEYPCHSPTQKRWFTLQITKFEDEEGKWIILAHEDITERKRVEEALRESEKRYRGLFENLVIGFALHEIVTDAEGRPVDYLFLEINPAFEKLTGIRADQAVGKRVKDILPGIENDRFIQIYGQVALTGIPVHFEEFVQSLGKYYEINAYSPKHGQFTVTFADITQRKQAEKTLHRSEALYRQAIEIAGAVPYYESYYDEGRLIKYDFIGEGIREITGYGPEEFDAKIWDSLVEEVILVEDLAGYSLEEGIERVREGENSIWKCEHRLRDREGKIHWVFEAAVEFRDENGISHGSIGTYQDITARKLAVEAEHEQRTLAEALRDTAETLSSSLSYEEVLDHILAAVGRVVPHDAATIMLIAGESAHVVRSYGYDNRGFDIEIMGIELRLAETHNLREMIETRQPVIVSDTHSYPGWKRLEATDWLRSNVGAPISIQDQVIGFILLDGQMPGFFTPVHAERLEAFANQAAIAIHNAHLLRQAQEEIAERKRAEEALRESERRYRALFEDTPIAIWEEDFSELKKHLDSLKQQGITDFRAYFASHPETVILCNAMIRVLNVNNATLQIYRAESKEELIASTIQVASQGELEHNHEDFIAILEGKTSNSWEGSDETLMGEEIEVAVSWSVVPGYEEDLSKVILTTIDITDRKQAEEAFRDSEAKYRSLAENSLQGIAIYQGQKIVYANPAMCQINGYTVEELTAMSADQIIALTHPDDRSIARERTIKRIAGEDISPNFEGRILRKDGTIAWLQSFNNPIEYDGKPALLSTMLDVTERKQAEEELRASEERFRQLADNIQEAFWMTDAESGEEIYMSPAAAAIWERPIEVLMHEPDAFINRVFPADQFIVMQAIEKEKAGERVDIEYRIIRPNGAIRWIWDRAFPISDDSGKVKRIAGISADITERRESEIALIKSQSRYRELFDSSPISIWEEDYSLVKTQIDLLAENGVADLKSYLSSHPEEVSRLASLVMVTDVNKASLELYHLEHKEALLINSGELLSVEAIGHFQGEILGLVSPAKRFQWEGPDKRYDGKQIDVIVSGSISQGYEEDWSKVIVSIIDITERRQAEQQLRKLSRAVEHSASTIVITDTAGNIEYVNPKFTEVTGYSFEEAAGQNPRILKSGLTSRGVYQHLWQTIISGKEWRGELQNRKKNGDLFWEYVTISPVLNEQGEITHFVGVKEDITQRKEDEIEIGRHMAELEALYECGLAIGRLLKPNEIGNRVINTFTHYLSWHHVTIRLRKEDSDDLELIAFNLPFLKDEDRVETERKFSALINKVGHGLSGWVMQTGMPFRTGNVHAHPQYVNTHPDIHSGLYMPLTVGGRVIGVISVESETPDAFTEHDERLLATLSNQAAIAFENARLYETVQQELVERKRAEEALRASEVHYRELADSITDILFELDQDLRYTHWNKASEFFSGIPAKEVIGKSIQEEFGDSDEQSEREEIYKSVLREQRAGTFETEVLVKGQRRALEINAYPSARGVSVVAKDVTERKRSEIIMQKRLELMEYAFHHSLDDVMRRTIDEISELTESHIGFLHFFEADEKTISLQTWSTETLERFCQFEAKEALYPLDQAGVWADAIRQHHSVIHNDYESLADNNSMPEGHAKVIREMVIPIIRNEKVKTLIGVGNKVLDYTEDDLEIARRFADYAWDITERKQMELALEAERKQLAQRVDERTADLSRANSNLARALRVKDEFLANMSHELRTPLNAILGLSESLTEQTAGPLNEKQQKYIATISESGHHLLSLINDILDLAKIDAGQITLDINKVDVRSVCQASLRMIKQLAQKKHQDVALEIDGPIGLMWADERRLKQMLVNLLGNAVKFTPENGKLGLEVHGDEEANKISFTVWDRGIGIKEEDLMRLFQPFVQLDSGLARETTGTGLGLALVAQMARLHGGSIQAVSEPENGSRFSVVLPWEPALAMDAAARLKITGKFRAIQLDDKNKPTILLVEDTQEVTMMIKDYLELTGYKVVTAQDGVDAIVQAKLVRPDLILMDVQMPRMDGVEATRKLRSEPDFRDTPIIALTALAMPNDRERCLEAGMDEYISKPVNLKALIKVMQSCLLNAKEAKLQ